MARVLDFEGPYRDLCRPGPARLLVLMCPCIHLLNSLVEERSSLFILVEGEVAGDPSGSCEIAGIAGLNDTVVGQPWSWMGTWHRELQREQHGVRMEKKDGSVRIPGNMGASKQTENGIGQLFHFQQ